MILFGLSGATGDEHPQNGLFVIHADGSGLTIVVDTPDFKREPEWIASH